MSDHPRIRGEHPLAARVAWVGLGSSPHTRGAPKPAHSGDDYVRIIPAYAGSTASGKFRRRWDKDHPRIRGEHGVLAVDVDGVGGSSPHTRGARTCPYTDRICRGDHPRIRGEHVGNVLHIAAPAGSSPHTRGAHGFGTTLQESVGIIPAYAGSTQGWTYTSENRWDHPRIRGEHAVLAVDVDRGGGSSPHTRGARHHHRHRRPALGIIPAYAGSTPGLGSSTTGAGDHPRIRGEH